MSIEKTIEDLLDHADVKIDGDRPWDIKVNNQKFYKRILAGGSLALGESYMDGWWDCEAVDQFIDKILRPRLDKNAKVSKRVVWHSLKAMILNQQTKSKAKEVGKKHYDIGNELYRHMLDKRMNYSCAYWKDANSLDEAQEAKLDLICRKLKLKPGMNILDIGCGWGGLVKFAAEKYQVKAVGITISKEQAKLAQKNCAGLEVEVRLQDYRDLNEKFDSIVSVGMFEHVGYKNYKTFMEVVDRNLKDNGLFLLHTIGGDESVKDIDPWIEKYIFPNAMLPSVSQIAQATEGLFTLRDWHSFGTDYDKTLMAWYQNFNDNWDKISDDYDERFKRMWHYYLLSCAGTFRAHRNQLWQVAFSKIGSVVECQSVR